MTKESSGGGRRRRGPALERLLVGLLCLDPRLMAAYQVTLTEAAVDRGHRQPPAAEDAGDSITDRRQAAAGVDA